MRSRGGDYLVQPQLLVSPSFSQFSRPLRLVIDCRFTWIERSMTQYIFEMGMTCGGCANAARKVLGKLGEDKLKIDDINVETKRITVTTELPAEEVLEQLKKTGKEVKLIQ